MTISRTPGRSAREVERFLCRIAPDPLRRDALGDAAAERSAPHPEYAFCWHCRKPLHARADTCPFCGERQ
jgi:hypothetical protein